MKSKLLYIFLVAILMLAGCQGSTQDSQQVYQKRAEVISVSNEPASYRSFALVSSGNIHVGGKLTTDGPLADVHANGTVQARALSLSVSGKITAQNNTSGLAIRSFDYTSNVDNQSFVEVRALKVSEYLNVSALAEYYLLGSDGVATHRVKDSPDLALGSLNPNFIFNNGTWEISGDILELSIPVVAETDLQITTNNLFIAGTLMVQGNLIANGELNINTGTPFDKALIVDRNIEVNKLVAIGRVHGSGTFTSNGEVNILGNAEIDGDVTLYGDARINFLDNVYKAAISEAQNEILSDPYAVVDAYTEPTLMLVHSQLFSDAQGKNSVVLFTFVEGNYILNENTLFKLIETGQVDDFKFRSYLYGATMDYAAQLQKFGGLSPYYANKLALINKLKSQGNAQVKLTEALDIAPSNLYHSFEDSAGNKLGTYLIHSLATPFDIDNPTVLTAAQRDQVIYNIVHKGEIEAQRELDAQQALADQKAAILMDTTVDDYTRQAMVTKLEEQESEIATTDKVAAKAESEQGRVDEWVSYKELIDTTEEIDVADVVVEQATEARGWFSRIRRAVRRVFRNIYYCPPRYESRSIYGVTNTINWNGYKNDLWSKKISLHNTRNFCVPISASMVLNYNKHIKKGKAALYSGSRSSSTRYDAAHDNTYVTSLASSFGTTDWAGTPAVFTPWVSNVMTWKLWSNGTPGYTYSRWVVGVTKAFEHSIVRWYINHNAPPMYTVTSHVGYDTQGNKIEWHAMPVIGYTREYYTGWCWKRVLPERKWIMVDTTWQSNNVRYGYDSNGKWKPLDYGNSRASLRFDARSYYWSIGVMHYTWAW